MNRILDSMANIGEGLMQTFDAIGETCLPQILFVLVGAAYIGALALAGAALIVYPVPAIAFLALCVVLARRRRPR